MFWKFARTALIAISVIFAGLLTLAALMSDRLTHREAVARIIAADEPCRDVFAKVLDLYERDMEAASKASAEGEPVCRSSFEGLDKISIFVPQDDYDDERLKRDAIKACAELSRIRADLLTQFGSDAPDEGKMSALNKRLAEADKSCQGQFKRLSERS